MLDDTIFENGVPTKADIRNIIDYFNSPITNEERSKTLALVQYGVENALLDPTEMMITALPTVKDTLGLVMIGYLFRLGADPNEYVTRKDAFPIHVLLFAIGCIIGNGVGDEMFIRFVINLFVYFGTFIDKPSVITDDDERKKLKSIFASDPSSAGAARKLRDIANIREYSVRKWIETQTFIEVRELISELEVMPAPQKKVFGLIVDDPELVYIDETIPRFDDIILSRSFNVGKKLPLDGDFEHLRIYNGMSEGLTLCTYAVFEEMFEYFIDVGLRPSFFDINSIISEILSDKITVTRVILTDMMIYAVERGAPVDNYQLRSFGASVANRVEDAFNSPYWQKECKTLGIASNRLKKIALTLSLDYDANKKELCSALNTMLKGDFKSIAAAFRKRQQQRFSSTVSTAEDYLQGTPELEPENKDYLNVDPFLVNDIQIAFYQGSKLYCFTSDRFEDLLRSKTNPINGEKLPSRFLFEIKSQLEILKYLEMEPGNVNTIDKVLRETIKNDQLSNKESENIISSVENLLSINDIDIEKIRSTDADVLNSSLSILGFDQIYLPLLGQELIYVTFCRAVYKGMQISDVDTKKKFVSSLLQI